MALVVKVMGMCRRAKHLQQLYAYSLNTHTPIKGREGGGWEHVNALPRSTNDEGLSLIIPNFRFPIHVYLCNSHYCLDCPYIVYGYAFSLSLYNQLFTVW